MRRTSPGRDAVIDDVAGLRRILRESRTVAMVGLSAHWHRPSFFVAKYLQEHGFRVVPVTPRHDEILGEKCYPSLDGVPVRVDVVDCFRRPGEIPAIAAQAIAIGARVLWMQLGIRSPEAAGRAEAAGLDVVQDRCMKIEYARLFGGLGFVGVNTGIISARRPREVPY